MSGSTGLLVNIDVDDLPRAIAQLEERVPDLEPYEPGFVPIERPQGTDAKRSRWRR